ncbi:aldehyde dehydrogenase family protein [Polaribacter sp.]|nr:aldehyde dehydrogenase family protein [Polaribacter sp.]
MNLIKNYINGEWIATDCRIANINPSNTEEVLNEVCLLSQEQVTDCISAAVEGEKLWREVGIEQRSDILKKIGDELISNALEIGEALAKEEGKTVAEGKGEVYRSGQFFHYYAAECLRQMGEFTKSVRPEVEILVEREPMGVVGIITPWNFPIAVAAWKVAPALAYGNSVVLKPATLTPHSAYLLAKIIDKAGLPNGVFNLVYGSGGSIGRTIACSPKINAITFTGSYQVGQQILSDAYKNMTKCQFEMGSKNALLISEDADLKTAVDCAIAGGFTGTGQKCTASSRVVIESGIYDEFKDAFIKRVESLIVGSSTDPKTQIGPLSNKSQLKTVVSYLEEATKEGATILCGGTKIKKDTPGYYFSPCVLGNTTNEMKINREEVFGPLVCLIKVDNFEEGIAVVNDTPYGLVSGVITQSLSKAMTFRKKIKTGCVAINLPTAGTDYHVPFGGMKASSFGSREQGTYAKEFYTQVKTTYLKA